MFRASNHPSPATIPRSRTEPDDLHSPTDDFSRSSQHQFALSVSRMRFLASTKAPMKPETMNVTPDRSTSRGGASCLHQRISQTPADTMSNSPCSATMEARKVTGGDAELGRHGGPFPPKVAGGELPRGRSALFYATPTRRIAVSESTTCPRTPGS